MPEVSNEEFRARVTEAARKPLLMRIAELEAQIAAAPQAVQPAVPEGAEAVQWRNINKVVNALADFCFGSKDDPKWGVAHISMTQSLTAKDGLNVLALGLEKLPAPAHPAEGVPAHELIDWDSAHKIAFQAAAAFRPSYFKGAGFVAHNWVVEAIRSAHIDGQRHVMGLPAIDRSGAFAAELRKERASTQPAAQGLDAKAMSEWLLARRSHLGSSRESAANWCEHWGAKSWDNYTQLSKHFAAQAKQGGAA